MENEKKVFLNSQSGSLKGKSHRQLHVSGSGIIPVLLDDITDGMELIRNCGEDADNSLALNYLRILRSNIAPVCNMHRTSELI